MGFSITGRAAFTNQQLVGNLSLAFTRGVETIDAVGNTVAANAPRYEKNYGAAARLTWTDTELNIPGTNSGRDFLAMGVASDGVTPLGISFDATSETYHVWEGWPLVNTRSITRTQLGVALGKPATHNYVDAVFRIHHGYIGIVIERQDTLASNQSGMTLAYSTDAMQTVQYIQARDASGTQVVADANTAIGDIPLVALAGGDVITDILRTWSFTLFPGDGLNDRENAKFVIADYQNKSANPAGGQVATWVIGRTGAGAWSTRDGRLMYEFEIAGGSGLHAHDAWVTPDGLRANKGDGSGRNGIDAILFEWDGYETATITIIKGVHGSTDIQELVGRLSPQQVAAVPWGPDGRWAIGSCDEQNEMIAYEPRDTPGLAPTLRSFDWKHETGAGSFSGGARSPMAPLHAIWVQTATGNTWVFGSLAESPWHHFSKDGVNLCRLSLPDGEFTGFSRIWTDGARIYRVDSGSIYWSDLPDTEVFTPLGVQPGGLNLGRPDDWTSRDAPNAANSVEPVTFVNGEYRQVSDNALVAFPGSPTPKPPMEGPITRYKSDGTSLDFGTQYITPTLEADWVTVGGETVFDVWVMPVGDEGYSFSMNVNLLRQTTGAPFFNQPEQSAFVVYGCANQWTKIPLRRSWDAGDRSNSQVLLDINANDGIRNIEMDLLVMVQASSGTWQQTYPIAPSTTVATGHERAIFSDLGITGTSWTAMVAAKLPETYFGMADDEYLATFWASDNEYIEVVRVDEVYEARVYSGGALAGTLQVTGTAPTPGQPVNLILTSDGTNTRLHVSTDEDLIDGTIAQAIATAPTELRTGSRDGADAPSLALLGVLVGKGSATATEVTNLFTDYPSRLMGEGQSSGFTTPESSSMNINGTFAAGSNSTQLFIDSEGMPSPDAMKNMYLRPTSGPGNGLITRIKLATDNLDGTHTLDIYQPIPPSAAPTSGDSFVMGIPESEYADVAPRSSN